MKILLARMEALETKLEKLKTASTTGNIPPPLDTDLSPVLTSPVLASPGFEKEKATWTKETWTERPFSLETEIIKIKSEDWFLKMDEFGKYLDKATFSVGTDKLSIGIIAYRSLSAYRSISDRYR
jgi:hypothetical protein